MSSLLANSNRLCGKRFEAMVQNRARLTGHLCIKNPLAFQRLGGGQAVPVHAELDFTIVNGRGQVAFIDAKVISRKSIASSQFAKHQVAKAYQYNRYRVPSGFIVLFTPLKAVYFISGLQMRTAPKGSNVPAESGLLLGDETSFDIHPLFDCHANFAATF